MRQFIEECRREWKRLRVPDPVADEMAAELAADLEEADAEGAAAEEVLGSGASDPRSFAASWAAERGVIPPAPVRGTLLGRPLTLAAIVALTVIAVVGAALAIFASPRDSAPATSRPLFVRVAPPPTEVPVWAPPIRVAVQAPSDLPANGSAVDIHTVGSIVLTVGIVGMILVMLFLFWSSSAGPGRRSTYSDQAPGGPGYI